MAEPLFYFEGDDANMEERNGTDNFNIDTFKSLKAKIDTEIKRRCLNNADTSQSINFGSLRPLTTDMEFKSPLAAGEKIVAEHGQKSINFLYEITDLPDIDWVIQNDFIPTKQNMLSLDSFLATLSEEEMQGDTSSCRGACTGLCAGSCISGCSGCTNACTGECSGCTASCGSGCANSSMYA